jgi:hypothetical protein
MNTNYNQQAEREAGGGSAGDDARRRVSRWRAEGAFYLTGTRVLVSSLAP